MLVRASSIRLIRASRPPVVVRFSLLHRDRKSFTYSLQSSRSEGIGPRIVRRGSIPCSASRRHVFETCVVYALKTPCRMQVQLALRLRLHLRRFWRSLLLSRRWTRKKQTGTENFVQSEHCYLSHVETKESDQVSRHLSRCQSSL